MALSSFSRVACKIRCVWVGTCSSTSGRLTVTHLGRMAWSSKAGTSPTRDRRFQTRIHHRTRNHPPRATDQTPTYCIKAILTFVPNEINETCGDCDMGAHIWVSSFCSLMWIARGRTGRALRCASASTNTVSTPMARTLRICACDRSLAPVPKNSHRKKERPK